MIEGEPEIVFVGDCVEYQLRQAHPLLGRPCFDERRVCRPFFPDLGTRLLCALIKVCLGPRGRRDAEHVVVDPIVDDTGEMGERLANRPLGTVGHHSLPLVGPKFGDELLDPKTKPSVGRSNVDSGHVRARTAHGVRRYRSACDFVGDLQYSRL